MVIRRLLMSEQWHDTLEFCLLRMFIYTQSPGVDSAPGENEYQEHFLEVKAAGA